MNDWLKTRGSRCRDRPAELLDREPELAFDLGAGLRIGASEHQSANPLGVPKRQLLGDHSAHRHADDMDSLDAERVQQARSVVGHLLDRVRPGRLGAAADATVVEHDRAVALGEVGDLVEPRRGVGGEPHDQEERVAAAVLFVE